MGDSQAGVGSDLNLRRRRGAPRHDMGKFMMTDWKSIAKGAFMAVVLAAMLGADEVSSSDAAAETAPAHAARAGADAAADIAPPPTTQPAGPGANDNDPAATREPLSPAQQARTGSTATQGLSTEAVSSYFGRLLEAREWPVGDKGNGEARDPFSASSVMQEQANLTGGGLQFLPGAAEDKVPRLHLRGYVEDESGTAMALVEVEKHDVFLVRQGDDISLQQGTSNLVLRVVSVTHRSVVVEAGTLGHVIVVR